MLIDTDTTSMTTKTRIPTPLKAIRAKCLDCTSNQHKEIRECGRFDCPLHKLRSGRRNTGTWPVATMRRYCVEFCCYGDSVEVRLCEAYNCPLWSYRFGQSATAFAKANPHRAHEVTYPDPREANKTHACTLYEAEYYKQRTPYNLPRKRHSKTDRQGVIRRCEIPNCNEESISKHHIIPRSEGGKHNRENIMRLCLIHHDMAEASGLRTREAIVAQIDSERAPTIINAGNGWVRYIFGGEERPTLPPYENIGDLVQAQMFKQFCEDNPELMVRIERGVL